MCKEMNMNKIVVYNLRFNIRIFFKRFPTLFVVLERRNQWRQPGKKIKFTCQ